MTHELIGREVTYRENGKAVVGGVVKAMAETTLRDIVTGKERKGLRLLLITSTGEEVWTGAVGAKP